GLVQGHQVPDDCEVIWQNPQFRTLTELAAASVQLVTAGVPWRTRMELLDFTPSQIDRMETERTQDAMMDALLGPQAPATAPPGPPGGAAAPLSDRKSTRLNSSHDQISYAVFCLKKKKKKKKKNFYLKKKKKKKKKNKTKHKK